MIKRLLCASLPRPGHPVLLSEEESEHAIRVLRLRDGDPVEILNGQGGAVKAILRYRGIPAQVEFAEETTHAHGRIQIPNLVLEMAILKGDAMEWVVEKAVELGVKSLTPIITDHTVVQLKQKGPETFQRRWQKIADQALKQCGRLDRMPIALPISLEELLASCPDELRLWFDEATRGEASEILEFFERQKPGQSISAARLLIGPEGGWSHHERELLGRSSDKIIPLSLGPWVLRAETAAVSAISLASAQLRRTRQPQPIAIS